MLRGLFKSENTKQGKQQKTSSCDPYARQQVHKNSKTHTLNDSDVFKMKSFQNGFEKFEELDSVGRKQCSLLSTLEVKAILENL